MHIRSRENPFAIANRKEDVARFLDTLKHLAVRAATNGLCGKQTGAFAVAMLNNIARLLEPVATEIGKTRNAVFINAPKFALIFPTKFFPDFAATQKWRIADNHVAAWPFSLGVKLERVIGGMFAGLRFFERFRFAAEMRDEERVFVLEVFQILQDRLALVSE